MNFYNYNTESTSRFSMSTARVSMLVFSSILETLEDLRVNLNCNTIIDINDNIKKQMKNGLIDLRVLDPIFQDLSKKISNPGLKIGQNYSFKNIPELDEYLSSCSTLREALLALFMVTEKLAPFLEVSITEDENTFSLFADIAKKNGSEHASNLIEIFFCLIVKKAIALLKESFRLNKIIFSHKLSGPIEEYKRAFPSTIQAGSTINAIILPTYILDIEINKSKAKDFHEAQKALEIGIGKYEKSNSISTWVAKFIDIKIDSNYCLSNVSTTMHLSNRTLQRKLSKEGTTFRKVSHLAKFELSKNLLLSTSMPIKEISINAGFSDRRSFSRFFEKMSGMTPTEYRKGNITDVF